MHILHIDSSILGEQSVTRQLSAELTAALQASQPNSSVTYRDVVSHPLPHLTADMLGGTPARSLALEELFAADVIVIGAPMYNFSIPSQLKAWIDHIVVVGKTFKYTEAGPVGLVENKKVYLISGRGGIHSATPTNDSPSVDFQERYLETVLGFIGLKDTTVIRAEGIGMGLKDSALAAARAQILALTQ
ncbi:MAG: FMN-dependent NADH-azoreductase [Neisseriaceae bacterium]|nr:FMN-dependent NADH-azoreductase [Neisseriaceae bacterium]